jgi:hypothetical protein
MLQVWPRICRTRRMRRAGDDTEQQNQDSACVRVRSATQTQWAETRIKRNRLLTLQNVAGYKPATTFVENALERMIA